METEIKSKKAYYPYAHSFARYSLLKNNYEIWRGNQKLFDHRKPQLPILIPSYFNIRQDSINFRTNTIYNPDIGIQKSISYSFLLKKGFIIKKCEVTEDDLFLREKGFKTYFKIVLGNELIPGFCRNIPRDHILVYDVTNKAFKLNGPKALIQWVYEQEFKIINYLDDAYIFPFKRWKIYDEESSYVNIKEIPIGIDHDNSKLICIPNKGDIGHTLFVGTTGSGKSYTLHSYICQLYNYDNDIVLMNDWNNETYSWNLPTDERPFLRYLLPLNIKPKPLPTVHLYPSHQGCDDELRQIGGDEGISANILMDWEKLLIKYNEYTSMYAGMSFRNSLRYINFHQLAKCQSLEEIELMINQFMDKKEIPKNSKYMVQKIIEFIIKKEITNIGTKFPARWKVKKKSGSFITLEKELSPIMACVYARLIPEFSPRSMEGVQMSSDSKGSIIPMYMTYLINQIYEEKISDEYFKQRNLYIAIDEIGAIISKGVEMPIEEITARGRFKRIALLACNQLYSTFPKSVRENTSYVFCFGNSKRELNEMRKDNFVVPKEIEDELAISMKKFECYVFHKKPLVAYDLETGRRTTLDSSYPTKIIVLPPTSKHSKPMEAL